jgi:repressor of nif and glnA expression
MATQQVTIDLPEAIFHQLIRWAETTRQPIEALVAQSVVSNLPPMVEPGAVAIQAELLNMQALSVEELLAIAHSQIAPEVHQQHVVLLEKNQEGDLTVDERENLMALQAVCDRLMLRKAYAWSMLRWRGYPIPAIQDLAIVG